MFDINDLIIPSIQQQLVSYKSIEEQAVFLWKLVNFGRNFPKDEEAVTKAWKEKHNDNYPSAELYKITDAKPIIIDCAVRSKNIDEVKQLLNELCNDILDEMGNFDNIVSQEPEKMYYINNIDKFDSIDEELNDKAAGKSSRGKTNSINRILNFSEINKQNK